MLLIVASTLLPWATYTSLRTNATTVFRGGPLSVLLLVLGAASVVLSLPWVTRELTLLKRLDLLVGSTALLGSIVLAVSKISIANHAATSPDGGGRTSYASGAVVAILASAAIVVANVVALSAAKASDGRLGIGTISRQSVRVTDHPSA